MPISEVVQGCNLNGEDTFNSSRLTSKMTCGRVTNKMTYSRRYSYLRSHTGAIPKLKRKKKACLYLFIYLMSKQGMSQFSFPEKLCGVIGILE